MEKCLCGRWFKSRKAMFGHARNCEEYVAFKKWEEEYKVTTPPSERTRWSDRAGHVVPWGWKDYYRQYVEIYGYNRVERGKNRRNVKNYTVAVTSQEETAKLQAEVENLRQCVGYLQDLHTEEVEDALSMKRETLSFLQTVLIPDNLQRVAALYTAHWERSRRRIAARQERNL